MELSHRIKMPITASGNGTLHRAIVSLPDSMCEESRLEEKVVFFEVPPGVQASTRLAQLLALAWCVDTEGWVDQGYIYNTHSLYELRHDSEAPDDHRPYYLFETGAGGEQGLGPYRTHYAKPDHVAFFVTPRVAKRLEAAVGDIQESFDAKLAVEAYLKQSQGRADRAHVAMEAWNTLTESQRGAVLSMSKTAMPAQAMAYLVGNEAAAYPAAT